jgi:hypothetical protein
MVRQRSSIGRVTHSGFKRHRPDCEVGSAAVPQLGRPHEAVASIFRDTGFARCARDTKQLMV